MKAAGPSVEFFGVRGSFPAVGPQFSRFGGNTSSLCIKIGERRLIFDGGLGTIPLGRAALEEKDHVIFLSHLHYDHLVGLPFFAPLFSRGHRVRVFAPATMVEALKAFWGPPYFPLRLQDLPAEVQILPTPEGEVDLADLLSLPSREGHPKLFTRFLDRHYHPMDGVMMHRVSFHGKDVVYATDIEVPSGGDIDAVSHFCMDADVLICDTQYEDKEYAGHYEGFGHNSMDMTIRLTQASTIKQLILFHHAPDRDDVALAHLQEVARARFPHTQAAYEGLVIQL